MQLLKNSLILTGVFIEMYYTFIIINNICSNFKDIVAKFPNILRVTGNAVKPKRKTKITAIKERNFLRYLP